MNDTKGLMILGLLWAVPILKKSQKGLKDYGGKKRFVCIKEVGARVTFFFSKLEIWNQIMF